MIIEFTGLPGSGKSTVCKDLEPWLESQGFDVINWIYYTGLMSKFHRIAHKIKVSSIFICTHPILFRSTFRLVLQSKQKYRKEIFFQLLNLIYVSALYRRYSKKKYQNSIILFDQGKVQALISLIYTSGMGDVKFLYKDPIYRLFVNDVVIQINVSIEESFNRLGNREGAQSRIERLKIDDMKRELVSFKDAGEIILEDRFLYKSLYRIESDGLNRDKVLSQIKEILMLII